MSLLKHAKSYLINQSKYAHLNAFNSLADLSARSARIDISESTTSDTEDALAVNDKPIAIKDNICTKDLKTTASSGILKDFTSPYDATVVKLLQDAGAVVAGKTNMDEFGMGSHSINSHFGPVKMQRIEGEEASAGGSSGGSALAIASGQCWASLGTDTGGSVRLPAAYTGVVGFKPSYGLLSRWGVIAYANSLDTVGVFGRSAKQVEAIFDKLNVYDPQDPTSLPPSTRARLGGGQRASKALKIGIPLDYNIATLDPTVKKAWIRTLRKFWEDGHTLHPVKLPATQHALSSYYVLAPAEASSNLAKYDGVRFGSRAEGIDGTPESVLFAKTRGQGFGPEVQRRILLGAFSLSAQAIDNYFIQAQKVRRMVQHDFNNVFAMPNPLFNDTSTLKDATEKVDVLICPTAPSLAPSLCEVKDQDPIASYMNDVFTVPASLAGLPAVSVPVPCGNVKRFAEYEGERSLFQSVGIQIIGQYGDDKLVLDYAKLLQVTAKTPQVSGGPDVTAWGHTFFGESTANERNHYGARALELGITIKEAKTLQDAELDLKVKEVETSLKEACGSQHLDDAAAMRRCTRKEYVAMFVGATDPVAAEAAYHHNMKARNTKKRKEAPIKKLNVQLTAATGDQRLNEAAAMFKLPRDKYVARFLEETDPVAAERAAFAVKKEQKDAEARKSLARAVSVAEAASSFKKRRKVVEAEGEGSHSMSSKFKVRLVAVDRANA